MNYTPEQLKKVKVGDRFICIHDPVASCKNGHEFTVVNVLESSISFRAVSETYRQIENPGFEWVFNGYDNLRFLTGELAESMNDEFGKQYRRGIESLIDSRKAIDADGDIVDVDDVGKIKLSETKQPKIIGAYDPAVGVLDLLTQDVKRLEGQIEALNNVIDKLLEAR